MKDNNGNSSDPISLLKKSGELISPTGGHRKGKLNPLKSLSCEEVLKYLPDFCEGKLGENELLLKKMEKHLKNSVIRKCGCADEFGKIMRKK